MLLFNNRQIFKKNFNTDITTTDEDKEILYQKNEVDWEIEKAIEVDIKGEKQTTFDMSIEKVNESELIKIAKPNETNKEELINLYCDLFPKINIHLMSKWVSSYESLCYYNGNKVLGGLTFNWLNIADIEFADLVLLGVKVGWQGNGIGSKLLEELKSICNKIISHVDLGKSSMKFYRKRLPDNCKKIGWALSTVLVNQTNTTCKCSGLTKEEKKALLSWNKVKKDSDQDD
jgi:hypothetical protein